MAAITYYTTILFSICLILISATASDWDFPIGSDDINNNQLLSVMETIVASAGSGNKMVEAEQLEAEANEGDPEAQSTLGFLYSVGMCRERNRAKGLVYHRAAADGGNLLSKMALANDFHRRDMLDKAVQLYAELAESAKNSAKLITLRIHDGEEANKHNLSTSQEVQAEDFQIMEHRAQSGDVASMYRIAAYYQFGLKGVQRDHDRAFSWSLMAAENGNFRSMVLLGEMYLTGTGAEKNYTKALEWLTLASEHDLSSSYNRIGYLYVNGYGVEKNYSQAKYYFEKAAEDDESGALYNLGIMYLEGLGVEKDPKLASKYFIMASNAGQPKALYQLAKMFHSGIGLNMNILMAIERYKIVAENGPGSSLSKQALESYSKGDVGKALFLYTIMAELGYEVAQSNAAWILHKYGEHSECIGESGSCTESERYERALSFCRQASEEGNDYAGLMIGDAYFYGRGVERDYERAVEAYMIAKSNSNKEALLKLGYMHEHGIGLPMDAHLAKRYYDQARDMNSVEIVGNGSCDISCWGQMNNRSWQLF